MFDSVSFCLFVCMVCMVVDCSCLGVCFVCLLARGLVGIGCLWFSYIIIVLTLFLCVIGFLLCLFYVVIPVVGCSLVFVFVCLLVVWFASVSLCYLAW